MRIPILGGHGFQNLPIAEKWASDLYRKLMAASPGAFLDVGANNGQTLLKVKAIDATRDYLGFEPNPICYHYTRRLIAVNNYQNCTLFPVGMSTENAILSLYHDAEFASGASVLPGFRENMARYSTVQKVVLMRGDQVLRESSLEAISVIKADVEGAELEVVQGLSETIQKYRPAIVLEILPVYSLEKPNGQYRHTRQQSLLGSLKAWNYQMFSIVETDASVIPLEEIEVHGDMGRTNYLFLPREKRSQFTALFKT